MNLYFIALVAPEGISRKVLEWKHWMLDNFGCRVALKSPAHITLIPPFRMASEQETHLRMYLDQFADRQKGFDIHLKDFSWFEPRVIFVQVMDNEALCELQHRLQTCLVRTKEIPIHKVDHRFTPHVTIANRDLQKHDFYTAKKKFSEIQYSADWPVDRLSLLRHNGLTWDIVHNAIFKEEAI